MITKEQLKERRNHIGSSDVSAILGVDPWRNELDIYYSKIYDTEDTKMSESVEIGTDLEPAIVNWLSKIYDVDILIHPDKLKFICLNNPIFSCNIDALLYDKSSGIEAKYTTYEKLWGHSGEYRDESAIPQYVYLQIQAQMLCTGFPFIYVGVWIASHGIDRRHFKIYRDEKMIRKIELYCTDWWNKYVIPKVKPPDTELPSIETLKSIKRTENIVDLPPEATQVYLKYVDAKRHYDEQKEVMKPLEKEFNAWQCALISLLGDNEAGRIGEGIIISFNEISRNVKASSSKYRKLKIERRGI